MRIRFLTTFLLSCMLLGGVARADSGQAYYAGVSQNAEVVFVADLQSLMASPLVMAVEQMMQMQTGEQSDPKELAMGITEHTGLTKDHLGKFVLSASDVMMLSEVQAEPTADEVNKSGILMAFEFNQAITEDQFKAWLESQMEPGEMEKTERKEVADGVIYIDRNKDSGMSMGMMPSDAGSVIFVGGDEVVTKALEAKKAALPKNLSTAEGLVPSIPNLLILASPSEKWKADLVKQAQAEGSNATYIKGADQFALGLNIADGLKLLSGIKFDNEQTANSAYTELDAVIAGLKSQPMEGGMMMFLGSVVNNLKASESGDQVSISTEMSPIESQQMLMMLPMMLMGLQMQQQQGGMPDDGMGAPSGM